MISNFFANLCASLERGVIAGVPKIFMSGTPGLGVDMALEIGVFIVYIMLQQGAGVLAEPVLPNKGSRWLPQLVDAQL